MADTYRFPNGGFEVVVCKKQDILDCIDKNVTDKEVLFDIINQLEKDASNFLKQGRWTGIPFIGNIRVPKFVQMSRTKEHQELIAEAKENLSTAQYLLFRKQLNASSSMSIKRQRYYKYILSIMINKNKNTYNKLCKRKGEHYAKAFLFLAYNPMAIDRELTIYEDE